MTTANHLGDFRTSTPAANRADGRRAAHSAHRGGDGADVPARALHPLREARHLLGGRSLASLYRDAKAGRLKLTRIGGRTYISAAEIARLTGTAD